jgi:hypothetical protein
LNENNERLKRQLKNIKDLDEVNEVLPDIENQLVETTYIDSRNRTQKMFRCSSLGALLVITLGPKANKNTGDIRTILARVIMEYMTHYENLVSMKIQEKITDMRDFGIGSRQFLSNAIDNCFTGSNFKYAIITNLVYDNIGIYRLRYPEGASKKVEIKSGKRKGKMRKVKLGGKNVNPERERMNEDTQGTLGIIEVAVSEMLEEVEGGLDTSMFDRVYGMSGDEFTVEQMDDLSDEDMKVVTFQRDFIRNLDVSIKMWTSPDKILALKDEMNRVIIEQIEEYSK